MKKKTKLKKRLVIALSVVFAVGVLAVPRLFGESEKSGIASAQSVTVYKSPSCGCCANYIAYLKREGYEVTMEQRENMGEIKEQFGIPGHVESCHTSVYETGQVVEGHIPVEAVEQMLSDSNAPGMIAMPGMPSGSPGMPGAKQSEFTVYGVNAEGDTFVYSKL